MRTVHLPGDDPQKPKSPTGKARPKEQPRVPELSPMARSYRDMATDLARSSACEFDHCIMPDEHQVHRSLHDILRDNRTLARLEDQWGKWWARLQRENDALWRRLNEVERQAAERGVPLDDEELVNHGAELQAVTVATEHARDGLDQFRVSMVEAKWEIDKYRRAGRSDTEILNALIKLIDTANDKAKDFGDLKKARSVVARQRDEWRQVIVEKIEQDYMLFEDAS